MAKVQTASNGRRFVNIDDVIERRLEQLKKARTNGNGNGHAYNDQPKDRSSDSTTVSSSKEEGRRTPAR
jgi:hypothetical protein